jgi:hypothetical protein
MRNICILLLILLCACKKSDLGSNSINPGNTGNQKIDTTTLVNNTINGIRKILNDAFRLKFITNRVRGEYSIINPSAWQGSFNINSNVTKVNLVFPSYYKISPDSITSPYGITSFSDHHSRYEYRVLNNRDTNRLEYLWVQRNLNYHPIDTLIWRMYHNNPYNWEKEYGIYINSNIKIPSQVLADLNPKWYNLSKLKGYDMIERWLTNGSSSPQTPNSVYKYKNFETCFYQNLSDSLEFYLPNSTKFDFLHKLNGFWLIEYPTYRRQVGFKLNHQVYNGEKFIERIDSLVVVNTSNTYVSSYNFGAMDSEAGVSRYNVYDKNKSLEKYIIIDRGEWNGVKATEESITYVDFLNNLKFIYKRKI